MISSFLSSLYLLNIKPLSDVWLVKILSHSVDWHFVQMMVLSPQQHSWPTEQTGNNFLMCPHPCYKSAFLVYLGSLQLSFWRHSAIRREFWVPEAVMLPRSQRFMRNGFWEREIINLYHFFIHRRHQT